MSGFAPGDLVVCVDAKPRPGLMSDQIRSLRLLREGRVYEVEAIIETPDGPALDLVGVPIPPAPDHRPEGWNPDRFRKIDKADEGFTAWMRACRPISKPAKTPANA